MDIETIGFNAMTDRVLCIGTHYNHMINVIIDEDEKKVLQEFWNMITEEDEIITFNGDGFDIPFLIKRSLINNIKIKKIGKSIDLKKVANSFFFSYNKFEKGKLCDWAEIMGMKVETENGSNMPQYYKDKMWTVIKDHCKEDTIITKALYDRCVGCGLI